MGVDQVSAVLSVCVFIIYICVTFFLYKEEAGLECFLSKSIVWGMSFPFKTASCRPSLSSLCRGI